MLNIFSSFSLVFAYCIKIIKIIFIAELIFVYNAYAKVDDSKVSAYPKGEFEIEINNKVITDFSRVELNNKYVDRSISFLPIKSKQQKYIFSDYLEKNVSKEFILELPSDFNIWKKNYDEILVEYSNIISHNPTNFQLELNLVQKNQEGAAYNPFLIVADSSLIDIIGLTRSYDKIDYAYWSPRNVFYLLKRELGIGHDKIWQYKSVGNDMVLQRRFNKLISKDDNLSIVLEDGALLKGINLRFSTDNESDIVLEWRNIPKHINETADRKTNILLTLGGLLKRDFFGLADVSLQEIIIWVNNNNYNNKDNFSDLFDSMQWIDKKKLKDQKETNSNLNSNTIEDNEKPYSAVLSKKPVITTTIPLLVKQLDPPSLGMLATMDISTTFLRYLNDHQIESIKLIVKPQNENKAGGVSILNVRIIGTEPEQNYIEPEQNYFEPEQNYFERILVFIQNNIVDIVAITCVGIWRKLSLFFYPYLMKRWPYIALRAYARTGSIYLSGFLVTIIGIVAMLIIDLDLIAEQLAVIGYYMLLVGLALEILDLRKDKPNTHKEK